MRKVMLLGIAVLLVMSCASCGVENVPEATQIPETAPAVIATQPHVCAEACGVCGLCMNAGCAEAVCAEKCTGTHREEPFAFSAGDYITTEAVRVDTGTLVFDIDENVYVPGNLAEMGEIIATEIEKVTGLDFDGAGYARKAYPDGKVHVNVFRDLMYAENPKYPWYQGLTTNEAGAAQASAWSHVEIPPGDLFVSGGYAPVHELAHIAMFRQSEWSHCQLLDEGFAEYTTYLVLKELEQTNPAAVHYLTDSVATIANMVLNPKEYEELYRQPMAYWFDHILDTGNGNYTIGFRFMAYLHEVYGDYSKWITEFEKAYNCNVYHVNHGHSAESPVQWQLEVLKATYGEDVLDNFYPWLKENEAQFDYMVFQIHRTDLSAVEAINWYPQFDARDACVRLEKVWYQDLYINLEPAYQYLSDYKQLDISDLYLQNPERHTIICYQDDGTFNVPTQETMIPLDGISYIKLVGKRLLGDLQIMGFDTDS